MRFQLAVVTAVCLIFVSKSVAETPSVELALGFRPVQSDIDFDMPAKADYSQCEVKVERKGKHSGWVVFDKDGRTLRRFVDTNQDNVVDQWRYYRHGLEVYRDMDLNFNNKVDESRWLNTAGTRWGVDSNEDGKIDGWKRISAEEASQQAIKAMTTRDAVLLQSLLVTKADTELIGMSPDVASTILTNVGNPAGKLQSVLGSTRVINATTKWTRFDSSTPTPSLIPAEDGKAEHDLQLYQSAMAIIDTAGKPGFVQLGELIKVGDTWKLTQIPKPIEGNSITATNVLMQPVSQSTGDTPGATQLPPEVRKLFDELSVLDRNQPGPTSTRAALGQYYVARANLLARLARSVTDPVEQEQWTRQWADTLAIGAETGSHPQGLQQLIQMETNLRKASPKSALLPQLAYRRLRADYSVRLSKATTEQRPEVQKWWLAELQQFTTDFPAAETTPDAMLDLGNTHEFTGNVAEARKWYTALSQSFPASISGQRGTGAMNRLDLLGKSVSISGPAVGGGNINLAAYRGRVVLVLYWATWCKPCLEELPQIKALYKENRANGFEILGVNLDATSDGVEAYLQQHQINWPQIHEAGGLESPPGRQFGIFTLPTMFLIDKTGKVVNASVSIDELKVALPQLLK